MEAKYERGRHLTIYTKEEGNFKETKYEIKSPMRINVSKKEEKILNGRKI